MVVSTSDIIAACEEMVYRFCRDKELYDSTRQELEANPTKRAEQLRNELHVGKWRKNAVVCGKCGNEAVSGYRHEFATCDCGNIAADGGTWYLRRVGQGSDYEDVSQLWPWLVDEEC